MISICRDPVFARHGLPALFRVNLNYDFFICHTHIICSPDKEYLFVIACFPFTLIIIDCPPFISILRTRFIPFGVSSKTKLKSCSPAIFQSAFGFRYFLLIGSRELI
jgi:hypothetical protein